MRDRRDTVEVQAKRFLIDHLWSGEAHASERLIIEESVIIAVPTAKPLRACRPFVQLGQRILRVPAGYGMQIAPND
jgi:hypothetical protein